MTRFDEYWDEEGSAKVEKAIILIIPEFGTRFAMLQAGDVDFMDVPVEQRAQVDPLVAEIAIDNEETNSYDAPVTVCNVYTEKLGIERFELCDTPSDQPLRLYFGRPGLQQDVILFNFFIQ